MAGKKRLKRGPALADIKSMRIELDQLLAKAQPNEDGSVSMRTHDYLRMQELVRDIKALKGESGG